MTRAALREAVLRAWATDRLATAEAIAARFGVSRSSVLGIVLRARLAGDARARSRRSRISVKRLFEEPTTRGAPSPLHRALRRLV